MTQVFLRLPASHIYDGATVIDNGCDKPSDVFLNRTSPPSPLRPPLSAQVPEDPSEFVKGALAGGTIVFVLGMILVIFAGPKSE